MIRSCCKEELDVRINKFSNL